MDKSYNSIRMLADLFAVVKIPNKLSGTVAGDTNLVAVDTESCQHTRMC